VKQEKEEQGKGEKKNRSLTALVTGHRGGEGKSQEDSKRCRVGREKKGFIWMAKEKKKRESDQLRRNRETGVKKGGAIGPCLGVGRKTPSAEAERER